MMSKKLLIAIAGASVLGLGTGAAYAYDGAQLAKDARVTMHDARAQALKLAPGAIKSAELESEHGGSGLRYSFDIQTSQGLREVGIDAQTGKVLEDSAETHRAEAAETRSEHEARGMDVEHESMDDPEHKSGYESRED